MKASLALEQAVMVAVLCIYARLVLRAGPADGNLSI